jgi:uncharacterized membrane protein YhaH (DUF805 family)
MVATLQRLVRQAFDFSGRASPREFWAFFAVAVIFLTPALLTEFRFFHWETYEFEHLVVYTSFVTGETREVVESGTRYVLQLMGVEATWLTLVPVAVFSIPFLAICTRRMHDLGRPGWWATAAVFCVLFLGPALAWLSYLLANFSPALGNTVFLLTGIPSFAVAVCALVLLAMWTVSAGEETDNEYGPNPREVTP